MTMECLLNNFIESKCIFSRYSFRRRLIMLLQSLDEPDRESSMETSIKRLFECLQKGDEMSLAEIQTSEKLPRFHEDVYDFLTQILLINSNRTASMILSLWHVPSAGIEAKILGALCQHCRVKDTPFCFTCRRSGGALRGYLALWHKLLKQGRPQTLNNDALKETTNTQNTNVADISLAEGADFRNYTTSTSSVVTDKYKSFIRTQITTAICFVRNFSHLPPMCARKVLSVLNLLVTMLNITTPIQPLVTAILDHFLSNLRCLLQKYADVPRGFLGVATIQLGQGHTVKENSECNNKELINCNKEPAGCEINHFCGKVTTKNSIASGVLPLTGKDSSNAEWLLCDVVTLLLQCLLCFCDKQWNNKAHHVIQHVSGVLLENAFASGEWILAPFSESDDCLVSIMHLLLKLYVRLQSEVGCEVSLTPLLQPHAVFLGFLQSVGWDASLLLDLLISPETSFLAYLTAYMRILSTQWSHFVQACETHDRQRCLGKPICDELLSSECVDTKLPDNQEQQNSHLNSLECHVKCDMSVEYGTNVGDTNCFSPGKRLNTFITDLNSPGTKNVKHIKLDMNQCKPLLVEYSESESEEGEDDLNVIKMACDAKHSIDILETFDTGQMPGNVSYESTVTLKYNWNCKPTCVNHEENILNKPVFVTQEKCNSPSVQHQNTDNLKIGYIETEKLNKSAVGTQQRYIEIEQASSLNHYAEKVTQQICVNTNVHDQNTKYDAMEGHKIVEKDDAPVLASTDECSEIEQDPALDRCMATLTRLSLRVERLQSAGLLPFDAQYLIRLLQAVEMCYEKG